MKKRIFALLLAGIVAVSMVACGKKSAGDKSADKSTQETKASNNTLTIYVWDEDYNVPALKAAEKDFQQVNPDFKLDINIRNKSYEIERDIADAYKRKDFKNLPDLVLFQDHSIGKYIRRYSGSFMSVDDSVMDWEGIGKEKVSYSTINGVHYGFPVDSGTAAFAYRVDLLKECGYTIKDVTDITWDEFDEIGKKVYAKTGKYLICAVAPDNDLVYMMMQEEGLSLFNKGKPTIAENDRLKKVIETIVKLKKDNVLYMADSWDDYRENAIGQDKLAGVFDGNWILSSIQQVEANKGKWQITYAPTFSGDPGYASNGGSSICVTSNCRNSKLAKEFLSYTFGGNSADDGHSITYDEALEKGGVIGTCLAAAQSDVYSKGLPYFQNQPVYATIVEYAQHVPIVEQSDYHYECRTYMSQAILKVIDGEMTVDEALDTVQTQLEEEMKPNYQK